jgi:hypothetical protein
MITGLPTPPAVPTAAGNVFGGTATSPSVTLASVVSPSGISITPAGGTGITLPIATDTESGLLDPVRATLIDTLAVVAQSGNYSDLVNKPDRTAFITVIFDGGGQVITSPILRVFYMPFAATITGWALMANQTGSVSIDVWKEPLSAFPPTVANSITGGSPMSISSAQFSSAFPVSASWTTTSINAGDCLAFNLSSVSSIQNVTAQLVITH